MAARLRGPATGGEESLEDGGGVGFGQGHRLSVDEERELRGVGDRPVVHEPPRLYRGVLPPTVVVLHLTSPEVRFHRRAPGRIVRDLRAGHRLALFRSASAIRESMGSGIRAFAKPKDSYG